MSIKLELSDVNFSQVDKQPHVQFIPAGVDEAIKANVDQFFNNYTTETDGRK